jgi:hypothetical protein
MKKILLIFVAGIIVGFALNFIYNKLTENRTQNEQNETIVNTQTSDSQENKIYENSLSIDELTNEKRVVAFLRENKRLPDYYITKEAARELGWEASKGNLCDVLPGRAIGGDRFSNREKSLPAKNGRQYFEADVNYNCGNRGTDRIVFSNDGMIFLTHNHYQTYVNTVSYGKY